MKISIDQFSVTSKCVARIGNDKIHTYSLKINESPRDAVCRIGSDFFDLQEEALDIEDGFDAQPSLLFVRTGAGQRTTSRGITNTVAEAVWTAQVIGVLGCKGLMEIEVGTSVSGVPNLLNKSIHAFGSPSVSIEADRTISAVILRATAAVWLDIKVFGIKSGGGARRWGCSHEGRSLECGNDNDNE